MASVLVFILAFTLASVPAAAQDIEVTSAFPASAPQGTVNLDVSIKGKGFKKGAVARFFVTGTTNPGGITVNATVFKSPTEVIANIDVADDALIEKFDIEVLAAGRTGKGTELFSVLEKGLACDTSPLPVGWTLVTTLNDPGAPQFMGEFGRAIAVDRIDLTPNPQALVVAVGSRTSGTVEVFLLDPTDGTVLPGGDPAVSLPIAPGVGSPQIVQGDANGDSVPDIVVGQEALSSASVFLAQVDGGVLSYAPAIPLLPPAGQDKASVGAALAVGDVEVDPGNEVLVGAPNATVGASLAAGKVFVFGFDGGSAFTFRRLVTRPGPKKSDFFGESLGVGHVVGDASSDLVVGADGVDAGAVRDVGKLFAFPGPLSSGAAPVELTRSVKGEGLGYRSAVADVDGDSVADVVTVGYLKAPSAVFTGLVSSGQPPTFLLTPQAGLEGGYGTNLGSGDVNGDGRADVLVGAPNATDNFGACSNTGAAYAYLSGPAGPVSSRLLLQPPDAAEGLYGWAVATGPGSRVLLVGEPRRTLGSVPLAGQVYVYRVP